MKKIRYITDAAPRYEITIFFQCIDMISDDTNKMCDESYIETPLAIIGLSLDTEISKKRYEKI